MIYETGSAVGSWLNEGDSASRRSVGPPRLDYPHERQISGAPPLSSTKSFAARDARDARSRSCRIQHGSEASLEVQRYKFSSRSHSLWAQSVTMPLHLDYMIEPEAILPQDPDNGFRARVPLQAEPGAGASSGDARMTEFSAK